MNMGYYGASIVNVIFNREADDLFEYSESSGIYGCVYYNEEIKKYCFNISYTERYAGSIVPYLVQIVFEKFNLCDIESIETLYYNERNSCKLVYHNIKVDNEEIFNILQLVRDNKLEWDSIKINEEMMLQFMNNNNINNDVINTCLEFCYDKNNHRYIIE